MKSPSFLICLALLSLVFESCEKDKIIPDPPVLPADRINFSDLEVGQRTYYRLAEVEVLPDNSFGVTYTGDTLIAEITSLTGDTFQIKEQFTEGSPNRDTVITRYCDEIQYGLRIEGNAVSPVRTHDCRLSYLFDNFSNSLPLLPGTDARAELDYWQVLPFDDGNDDLILNGYVENTEIAGLLYPHLLVQVDPSLEPLDGNRLSWLYRDGVGIARVVSFNGFAGRGIMVELLLVTP